MASSSVLFGTFSQNNDADIAADAARFQATQQTQQISIMGMNMISQANIKSLDFQFGVQSQERVAMAQMHYADLSDARMSANERRGMRNELRMAMLQFNAQIHQDNLGHAENLAKIDFEAKQLGYQEKHDDKEFALKSKEIDQQGMVSGSSFFT